MGRREALADSKMLRDNSTEKIGQGKSHKWLLQLGTGFDEKQSIWKLFPDKILGKKEPGKD